MRWNAIEPWQENGETGRRLQVTQLVSIDVANVQFS